MTNWTESVLMLAKHKMLEKMEELNKEDSLCGEDCRTYKSCAEALYYIMSVEKALEAKEKSGTSR